MSRSDERWPDFGGETQDAFIARIRRRLGASPSAAQRAEGYPGSRQWPADIEEQFTAAAKAEAFLQAWTDLGGVTRVAHSMDDVEAHVLSLLQEYRVKNVLSSGSAIGACGRAAREAGVSITSWDEIDFEFGSPDRAISRVNQWDAGITWVDYAVAETGSVAILSRPGQGRSVSLLPPLFIALIDGEKLLYARRTLFERVSQEGRKQGSPLSVTLISGPSRSADIEMDLSIGVHGPGHVAAVLLSRRHP